MMRSIVTDRRKVITIDIRAVVDTHIHSDIPMRARPGSKLQQISGWTSEHSDVDSDS